MISVLFARSDSIYKSLDDVDVWDIERDALNYSGNNAVIAHPPCRAWGKLKHFAKPRPGEKELAFFAVDSVRRNGGVLEHPLGSSLWKEANLPAVGKRDSFGGWTLCVNQHWFGHRARKATLLYIVGCAPGSIPVFPIVLGEPSHVAAWSKTKHKPKRPALHQVGRESTPVEFALWLCALAQKCQRVGL